MVINRRRSNRRRSNIGSRFLRAFLRPGPTQVPIIVRSSGGRVEGSVKSRSVLARVPPKVCPVAAAGAGEGQPVKDSPKVVI